LISHNESPAVTFLAIVPKPSKPYFKC